MHVNMTLSQEPPYMEASIISPHFYFVMAWVCFCKIKFLCSPILLIQPTFFPLRRKKKRQAREEAGGLAPQILHFPWKRHFISALHKKTWGKWILKCGSPKSCGFLGPMKERRRHLDDHKQMDFRQLSLGSCSSIRARVRDLGLEDCARLQF